MGLYHHLHQPEPLLHEPCNSAQNPKSARRMMLVSSRQLLRVPLTARFIHLQDPKIPIDKIKEGDNSDTELSKESDDRVDVEIDGPKGPEPTRYGDWEKNGRCYDF